MSAKVDVDKVVQLAFHEFLQLYQGSADSSVLRAAFVTGGLAVESLLKACAIPGRAKRVRKALEALYLR